MLIGSENLSFINEYIEAINENLIKNNPSSRLSKLQCVWLSFVLLGLLVTNSLCWKRFEKTSLRRYKTSSLCWMFHKDSMGVIMQVYVILYPVMPLVLAY